MHIQGIVQQGLNDLFPESHKIVVCTNLSRVQWPRTRRMNI